MLIFFRISEIINWLNEVFETSVYSNEGEKGGKVRKIVVFSHVLEPTAFKTILKLLILGLT